MTPQTAADTPRLYTDMLHRVAYATDASAYREIPQAVAYPRTDEEVRQLILLARSRGTHLIPRAGGTSIAGQVVGDGIVVDVGRYMNAILELNAEQYWVRVRPGVIRDELNLYLKDYGLFFSPETSTSNRCCIGGMVGNNSCGTHSLVYGSTRHHVLQIKGFLSDGAYFDTDHFLNGDPHWASDSPIGDAIVRQLQEWRHDPQVRQTIAQHFPDRQLKRRSCGYAIDEALEPSAFALDGHECAGNESIDLCKLICGSEGTLCFITEVRLHLDPLPPASHMVLCAHCTSLEASFEANLIALRHHPVAVELMDGQILDLCKDNPAARRNRFFVKGNPPALLIAEFNGDNMERQADELEEDFATSGLVDCCTRVYGAEVSRVWALRKAGLGVLTTMKGDAKPVGVIEDTAVAPERLPHYLADFQEMLQRCGTSCVFYGHISTGELHLRPVLNLKSDEGRRLFRQLAEETAKLVKKHHGSLSGEHGDGRLRGEFIPLMYGDECYQMMRQVKQCWDPDGVFNRGKIVDTPPMDSHLRYDGDKLPLSVPAETLASIEQCNGAADCRKPQSMGGTMCPAYKVSDRDELQSTRARANILREALTFGIQGQSLSAAELKTVLDSCLACKGCKNECPSNVDLTRIRAEVLQQLYHRKGTPFRSFMVARMAQVERLGACVPHIYNAMASWKPTASIIKKMVSFAPQRDIPKLHPVRLQVSSASQPRKVCLFLDEFTRYHEPALAQAFVDLLQGLGYQVLVPKVGESGRAAISKGCLDLARRHAVRNVKRLRNQISADVPLVGIEPSCILTFRDEYPKLVPAELQSDAEKLAKNSYLFDEFFMREVANGRISSANFVADSCDIWLHGHCHQKALVGVEQSVSMLKLIPEARVHVVQSPCCGMAGSFGYEKEHYTTSLAIGELSLFPTLRKALRQSVPENPTYIAAPGTSCRQQIHDALNIVAVHPIMLMLSHLAVREKK